MIPENRISTHPGEVLREEYLVPMQLTVEKLAEHVGYPVEALSRVVAGQAPVDARLAWLLSMALNTNPEFWLNLQALHDLGRARPDFRVETLIG